MMILLVGTLLLVLSQKASSHCIDIHSQVVAQGLHYVPGPNTCTLCICDKGSPKWCKSVLCKPPENCKSFQIGNSCCEFKCLDDILTNDGYKDTYDLALRLIASAFTALLSLSILFLLYHRLRRRKIRLRQTRPSNEDQRSLNSIGYITGGFGYHPASYGYLGSGSNDLEYPYEPNTQFSLWKPPGNYFPRGEAPPPYEEAVRLSQLEHDNTANNSVAPSTTQCVSNSNQVGNLTYTISTSHPNTAQPQYQNGCCVLLTRNEGASNESNKEHTKAQTSSSNNHSSNDKVHQSSRSDHSSSAKKSNNPTRPCTSEGSKQKSKSFENICERERGGNQASMPTSSDAKNHIYANQNIDPALHRQKFEEDSQRIAAAAASNTLIRRYVTKDNRHRTISKTFQNKNKVPVVNAMETVVKEPKRMSMSQLTRDMSSHRTLPTNLKEISIACTPEPVSDRTARELSIYKDHVTERPTAKDATIYKNQLPEVSTNRELSIYREKTSERPSSSKDSNGAKHGYKKESDTNCKTLTKSSNWSTIYIPSSSKTPILDKICQLKESIPSTAVETKDIIQYYKSHIPEAENSYQCLNSSQDDDEDYRSECENCKFAGITEGEDEIPETMTLQRRPLELEEEMSYYRTSLTLPTHSKKPRILSAKPERESWFLTMDEYSSSDDSA
ncbi:uncharacterized protein LOC123321649 isoform X2 [Coccinella septempunctata]|uniref:uncharacterized protein LOC123321649 isoform X2 n=1 Tax=Coccinella septempunctata TaxID=41139 RepID=UPI001D091044|nr:uncharacterized protein LOC123321649 isoform X2 [Coccinella septempunctata]